MSPRRAKRCLFKIEDMGMWTSSELTKLDDMSTPQVAQLQESIMRAAIAIEDHLRTRPGMRLWTAELHRDVPMYVQAHEAERFDLQRPIMAGVLAAIDSCDLDVDFTQTYRPFGDPDEQDEDDDGSEPE